MRKISRLFLQQIEPRAILTMRRSLQYSLVNQVLYAIDATITAKSLEMVKLR